jgi:hypothetical protein
MTIGNLYTEEPEVENLTVLKSDGKFALGVKYDPGTDKQQIIKYMWLDDKRFTDVRRGAWTCFESVVLEPDEVIMIYQYLQPLAWLYDNKLAEKEGANKKIADNMRDYWASRESLAH